MTETSMPWAGLSIGDHGPYSDDAWSDMYKKLMQLSIYKDGVITGRGSMLAVTNPAGSTIRVAPGAALVDGKFYESDANIDFTAVLTVGNYYWVLLTKTWATQEVRVQFYGPAIIPYLPYSQQVDGTIWSIPLGQVYIAAGPTIVITDLRNAIGLASPASYRQSGDPNEWIVPGLTNYLTPGNFMQVGSVQISLAGVTSGSVTITYPRSFKYTPVVVATIQDDGRLTPYVLSAGAVQADICLQSNVGILTDDFTVCWIAIGEIVTP